MNDNGTERAARHEVQRSAGQSEMSQVNGDIVYISYSESSAGLETQPEPEPAPQSPQSPQQRPESIPYSHGDHLRDAATILEIADEMALGGLSELRPLLPLDVVWCARRLLSTLSTQESEERRFHAIPRMNRVTQSRQRFNCFLQRFILGPTVSSPPRSSPIPTHREAPAPPSSEQDSGGEQDSDGYR
ncbi:hypothetical protein F4861DRAFT_499867 [Xylaria intraflava]|nr:hypothetical protein F4861DRAFT_499867 [Xylaria intraflava]